MRGQFRIGGVVEKWKEVFFADTDVELSLLLILSKHLSTQGERMKSKFAYTFVALLVFASFVLSACAGGGGGGGGASEEGGKGPLTKVG